MIPFVDNGKRYYRYDKQSLRSMPSDSRIRPSRDALAWHGEFCFLG